MRIRHKPWAKPELEACPFLYFRAKIESRALEYDFSGRKETAAAGTGLWKGRLYLAGSSRQSGLSLHRNGHTKIEMLVLDKTKIGSGLCGTTAAIGQCSDFYLQSDAVFRIFFTGRPSGTHLYQLLQSMAKGKT